MVTSDRISAFDVVMKELIPAKGRVLTAMTEFWFEYLSDIVTGHLLSTDITSMREILGDEIDRDLVGRVMLCRKVEILPIECIVRGYISGSAWKEYRSEGTIHGEPATPGLRESDRLHEPIFTPSTKAQSGHDVNIDFSTASEIIGHDLAKKVREISLECYISGAEWAAKHGIIIADTKFEFGLINDELVLADEVLTPDSSRFWSADQWEPGSSPPSFDKQPVRDFLENLNWDKQPPVPFLPEEVVLSTSHRYIEAYERITGRSFSNWPGSES